MTVALLESVQTPPGPSEGGPEGRPRVGRRPAGAARRDNLTAYLMIAPMVILLGIFVMWPLVYAVDQSVFEINYYKGSKFVGLQFYRYVLESSDFWHSIWIGLYYALIV